MLTKNELTAVDGWRFNKHMPSRAAAVRELLRRGLSAEGFVRLVMIKRPRRGLIYINVLRR